MKICFPVSSPDGLLSKVESFIPQTRYFNIYDFEKQVFEEIDLSAQAVPIIEFDVVVCASLNRPVFQILRQQGKMVYLTALSTVEQAIKEFESGEMFLIPDEAGGCGGGGCHGHGAHSHGGCQCKTSSSEKDHCHGGCGEHGSERHGGCCSGRHNEETLIKKTLGENPKIAVTSQNRKTVTEHAGKCRKFWIYETQAGKIVSKELLELPLEQSLHSSTPGDVHPLDSIDILITAGMGTGLRQHLASKGIEAVVTLETNPDLAVEAVLASM